MRMELEHEVLESGVCTPLIHQPVDGVATFHASLDARIRGGLGFLELANRNLCGLVRAYEARAFLQG